MRSAPCRTSFNEAEFPAESLNRTRSTHRVGKDVCDRFGALTDQSEPPTRGSVMIPHDSSFQRRTRFLPFVLILASIISATPALAQVGANVGGVVRDESGAVLPGVMI